VVARLRDTGWPGELSTVDRVPPPVRPAVDGGSVLFLGGPPAVGKSAVGFETYLRALRDGVPTAYIDLAQVAFCRPLSQDDPDHHRLKAHNLGRMWEQFRADGCRFLVVTGNVTDRETVARYRAAVPSSAFSVCRLRARPETLEERILLRGRGIGPGLVGDVFRGRPEAELRRRAREVASIAAALDRSGIGDTVIDTDGVTVADLASQVAVYGAPGQ
jgi:hypothetical protein